MTGHSLHRFATPTLAAAALAEGALVAHPTAGLWGIAADPRRADAVAALDGLKEREAGRGYIAVAGHADAFSGWYRKDDVVARLLGQAFPGPVTVVCEAAPQAPESVVGADGTVAIRVDRHPAVIALTERCGGPLISTSLNLAGDPPAADPDHLDERLLAALAGAFELPPTPAGRASTLVAWRPPQLVVLRAGAVDLAAIHAHVDLGGQA